MKKFLKFRTWSALMTAPVLIAVGAYNFVTGNLQSSHAWFIWGLVCMIAGISWMVVLKKQNKSNG